MSCDSTEDALLRFSASGATGGLTGHDNYDDDEDGEDCLPEDSSLPSPSSSQAISISKESVAANANINAPETVSASSTITLLPASSVASSQPTTILLRARQIDDLSSTLIPAPTDSDAFPSTTTSLTVPTSIPVISPQTTEIETPVTDLPLSTTVVSIVEIVTVTVAETTVTVTAFVTPPPGAFVTPPVDATSNPVIGFPPVSVTSAIFPTTTSSTDISTTGSIVATILAPPAAITPTPEAPPFDPVVTTSVSPVSSTIPLDNLSSVIDEVPTITSPPSVPTFAPLPTDAAFSSLLTAQIGS